ncbi:hypothetical protein V1477_021092 [Vespula maculifrons]|uniref:Uncharacterized protein n=1 Tax=Vespula maculifrons TaxID=7453 RepID=A0ABD2AJU3_VESMC
MKTFISFLVLYLNGKSINALFIERFYDGDKSISIDKWDIRSLTSSYPKGTPLVHINQEPIYFSTSVMKNITYGKQET